MKDKSRLIAENQKNWYFIDSVLFNDYAENVIPNKGLLEEFNKSKQALLDNLSEMYQYIGYSPARVISNDEIKIKRYAVDDAIKTKYIASKMMQKESVKANIKKHVLREFAQHPSKQYLRQYTDKAIDNRFKRLCLDNILIGIPVTESIRKNAIDDFKFQILEEGYYLLRNSLINIARVVNEALADYGIVRVLGFSIPDPKAGVQIQKEYEKQTTDCDKITNKFLKSVELAKVKVNTMNRIIVAVQTGMKQATSDSARQKFARDFVRAKKRLLQYQAALTKATVKYREFMKRQQEKQLKDKATMAAVSTATA